MKATQLCPPAPRPPPTAHGGHLRRRYHAAPAAGAAWSARLRGQHALRTPQQRFLAAPPQPRPPRAAARLPVGGARDGAAATPTFGAQAAQQATRRQHAVHRRGLAARRRVSASARRRSACVRFSALHSACSAPASVAAPRYNSRRPVRPSQPPASLHRRSCLAHMHRLQAHAAATAAARPPSALPRLTRRSQPLPHACVASSAPRTRGAALSAAACAAACCARMFAFASPPPARSSAASAAHRRLLAALAARLHRIWTLSPMLCPFARPAHPAHHRLAPPASERSLPCGLPLCTRHPCSSQALAPPTARPPAAFRRCTPSPLPQPRAVPRR
jgi:hypothetical protein